MANKKVDEGAVVVAQLVERLLPIPEIRGSNPVNGKFYLLSAILKSKNKEKEAGNGPLKKESRRGKKLAHSLYT